MARRARGGGERGRTWRLGLAIAGLASSFACSTPAPAPTSPLSLYLQARVARTSGEVGRAALLLEQALALAPDVAPIAAALGDARMVLGDDGGARLVLDRAVALDPDDSASCVLLARLDLRERRPAEALARLLAFDERMPARRQVLELVHPLLLWSGDTQHGLEVFDRALGLAPDLALVHEARGDFLACLGQNDAALASYRRALAIDPGRRGAELKAAHLLEKQVESLLRRLPPPSAPADPGVGLPAAADVAPGSR